MYDICLTESWFPAQPDAEIREITLGGLLREIAATRGEAEAVVEVRQDGSTGRCWTYAGLLADSERLATVFDGITRHSPEGMNFKARAEEVGWKQAVQERDQGGFDWTRNRLPGDGD